MSIKISTIIISLLLLLSCNNNDENKRPATALDTGRSFIRASLDGDFDKAENLLLKDTQNLQLFSTYKVYFGRFPAERKNSYKNASYVINKYADLDDSTTIINYSNSYMNKPLEIKLVKKEQAWWVDFKYTYSGNLPID